MGDGGLLVVTLFWNVSNQLILKLKNSALCEKEKSSSALLTYCAILCFVTVAPFLTALPAASRPIRYLSIKTH